MGELGWILAGVVNCALRQPFVDQVGGNDSPILQR